MVIFESKIKKVLRLSKYLFFAFVGVVLGFTSFQKGDSKAIFSGLSVNPLVAHADIPVAPSYMDYSGSDGSEEGSAAAAASAASDAADSGGAGSCSSCCGDDGCM